MDENVELHPAPTFRGALGRASAFRWLDGVFYLPLVLAAAIGVCGFFGSMTATKGAGPMLPLILFWSSPMVAIMAYVLLFRRNKPPGFDQDLWNTVRYRKDHLIYRRRARLVHPFDAD